MQLIKGWMTEEERFALRRWAFNRDVLEIGAFEGLSTIQLALTAKHVTTIDTFDGRGTAEYPRDTQKAFYDNIRAAGVANRVTPFKGESAVVLTRLDKKFEMIFIDGSHDYASVKADADGSIPLLTDDAILAFHDYDEDHPGVAQVVNDLCDAGAVRVFQENSLVAIRMNPEKAEPKKACIAIAMPSIDGWAQTGSVMAATTGWAGKLAKMIAIPKATSVLTKNFNSLLVEAMNMRETDGVTHFAMLHNDVMPMDGWLDVLLVEMGILHLDAISAVIPLKNRRGLTSTGLDYPENPWGVRRLTLAEVFDLPETFRARDVSYREMDASILLNTGCWLMRIDQPWIEGMCFRQHDRIVYNMRTKKYAEESISEDWDFSRQMIQRGARIAATRKVAVVHDHADYHNREPWGEWKTDEQFMEDVRQRDLARAEIEQEKDIEAA